MTAELEGQTDLPERVVAGSHGDRIREIARIQNANPSSTESQRAQIRAYAAEAELWIAEAGTKKPGSAGAGEGIIPGGKASASDEVQARAVSADPLRAGNDPKSRKIIEKLEEPVSMKFQEETPLEEIIKHIRESTKSSDMPGGIPIYVDPVGLSEADKTMASTVRHLDLEGIPLRRTLQLALRQLDLFYFVVDGMLFITSQESAAAGNPLPPAMSGPSALAEKLEKAERGELTLEEMKDLIAVIKANKELEHIHDVHDRVGGFGAESGGAAPPPALTEELKQNKQLVESLSKLTQSLLEELKEMRNARQAAGSPAAASPAPKGGGKLN